MGKPNDLIKLARADLTASEILLEANGGELLENLAAYHAQQAAEKICKGLITRTGHPAGQRHDIGSLLDDMDAYKIPYPEWLSEQAYEISRWATNVRYDVRIDVDHEAIRLANERLELWLAKIFR